MFEIGAGKADITAFKLGVGMLGYGMYYNIVKGVETNLYARAFVFRDTLTGRKFALVNAEVCFITIAVKKGVIKKLSRKHPELGYTEENVMLTAQHTHSAPGGFSHYGMYNMSVPGFVPEVFQKIVDGIVDAIVDADRTMRPATIKMEERELPTDHEVAFNRSIKAYNRNPDIDQKVGPDERQFAVDRSMTLLRFDDLEGRPIGSFNWFGVHTTSVSNDNTRICSDNKGYAAKFLEEDINNTHGNRFIAAFAQKVAGDVTPNFVIDRWKKWTRGKFEDDFESAKYNGMLQYQKAKEIYQRAELNEPLPSHIDHALAYVDFRNVVVDPEFAWGDKNARTGPACHGVAFFRGTKEGPGVALAVKYLLMGVTRGFKHLELARAHFQKPEVAEQVRLKYQVQGNKDIMIESGECRVLGTKNIKALVVPGIADPAIAAFKRYHRTGGIGDKPLVPQVLPLHIAILGPLAIVGVPAEMTTVAGRRLHDTIANILADRGVKKVLISTYANAYCGYITTNHEYEAQSYEGGHTVFGTHTLGAFQTKFKQLALAMLKPQEERTTLSEAEPVTFTDEELARRMFDIRTQRRLVQLD